MKKNYWQFALMLFFVASVSFVVIRYTNKQQTENNAVYPLLPRKDNNNKAEWLLAKQQVDKLIAKLNVRPGDTKTEFALANAYSIE